MNEHTARGWGFAAVATLTVIVALAGGGALGTWLALADLTDDPAVATRTILRALVVVAIAADVLVMARYVTADRRARRQP